jgi:hypothetical protein
LLVAVNEGPTIAVGFLESQSEICDSHTVTPLLDAVAENAHVRMKIYCERSTHKSNKECIFEVEVSFHDGRFYM